ncbi:MAG: TldD/PmbA family protein [Pseudonocardiales bacterium]|nr:TldD/PmbA family protein [Pseudonocardiales bacterium]
MMRPTEIVERALEASKASGCVVIVRESSEAVLRWANSTMTTNGHSTSLRWSVISLVDLDEGTGAGVVSSSASVTDIAQITDALRASELAARQSGPAQDAAPLPDESEAAPSAADWSDEAVATSVSVFGGLSEQLADAFVAGRSAGHLLFGFATHDLTTTWLGTSTGIRRRWAQPEGSVDLNARTPDGVSSAWGGMSSYDFADVDLTGLAGDLTTRLGWGKRRLDLPAGRYPTILPPSAMADLMIYFAWSMAGRPAQEGRSPFSAPGGGTRVGERLTDKGLTLFSDPTAPGFDYEPVLATTRSSDEVSVFDNGAAMRRVDWVREGVINELVYPRGSAKELGVEFIPPGENLLLSGGSDASLADLVGGTERGLLLTCLWYIREVDPTNLLLTGLTRDGVYLVEGGEVVGEVNNFRFNESPIDLIRRAAEVGATERALGREFKDWFTRTAMPPVLVPDFNMSSVSQAS